MIFDLKCIRYLEYCPKACIKLYITMSSQSACVGARATAAGPGKTYPGPGAGPQLEPIISSCVPQVQGGL